MSIISIRWAYSRPISNPVAKNVLVFFSTHDFPGNKSMFKIKTICDATAYSERAVRDAINYLIEHQYMTKNNRFGEDGRKLSNQYELLIDDKYVQDFYDAYELSTPHRQETPVPTAADAGTHRQEMPDYKNNTSKNNKKKSFYASLSEKRQAEKQNPPKQEFKTATQRREENQKKHDWAESKQQLPFADVTTRSNSFNPNYMNEPSGAIPDILAAHMRKNGFEILNGKIINMKNAKNLTKQNTFSNYSR